MVVVALKLINHVSLNILRSVAARLRSLAIGAGSAALDVFTLESKGNIGFRRCHIHVLRTIRAPRLHVRVIYPKF